MVGNGKSLPIACVGKGILPTPSAKFRLTNVLHTLIITHNLLSVFQFAKDNNCSITFNSSGYVIQNNQSNQILFQGPCHKSLYPLQTCFFSGSSGFS